MLIALVGALLDCIAERSTILQNQLYRLFFIVIYLLFVIRYYYGPDIYTYVPHFEQIAPPLYLIHHPEKMIFEPGYELLCSCTKVLGISYWGLTAIITTLYFFSLACLLHRLDRHKLFAFACVILFDYNLIYAQLRQCLAVTFFIFMVLCLQDKKYITAIVMGTLVVLFHKSGFIPICTTLAGIPLWNMRHNADAYKILLAILFLLLLIPVSQVSNSVLSFLPLPESYAKSIAHHVKLGKQIQIVGIVYIGILMLIIHLHDFRGKHYYQLVEIECLMGLVLVVAFYQYYYLLMRIRSYFIPIIAVYVISLVNKEAQARQIPYSALARQAMAFILILYFVHGAVRYDQMVKSWQSPVAKACTIFELRHASQKQICDRQMKIAEWYWETDYRSGDNNKL